MKNTKDIRQLRDLIGSKPAHFNGGKRQWSRLITSLLTPPDPSKTWVKRENGEWERE
jgi:hypothetical protein